MRKLLPDHNLAVVSAPCLIPDSLCYCDANHLLEYEPSGQRVLVSLSILHDELDVVLVIFKNANAFQWVAIEYKQIGVDTFFNYTSVGVGVWVTG